jgi:hypothetical protein
MDKIKAMRTKLPSHEMTQLASCGNAPRYPSTGCAGSPFSGMALAPHFIQKDSWPRLPDNGFSMFYA